MSPTSSAAISRTRRKDNQESGFSDQESECEKGLITDYRYLIPGYLIPGGAIAQLGERLNGIQEVGGSTPPGSTI
jgi:hypothetical protein